MSNDQNQKAAVNARRKFLTRTGTGLLIASIPAKSVWAQSIAGSIAASGHSSDWAEGEAMTLQSHGYWFNNGQGVRNDPNNLLQLSFSETFGMPLDGNSDDFDLWYALKNGSDSRKGPSNVHMQMVTVWLNAAYTYLLNYSSSEGNSFYYPIIGMGGGQFSSPEAFAAHLYSLAAPSPDNAGYDFGCLIDTYHNDSPKVCA